MSEEVQDQDRPPTDLGEALTSPATRFTVRVQERLDAWLTEHMLEIRGCAEASDLTELVMHALADSGVHLREIYRLRRIESALIAHGLPNHSEKGDPGGLTVDWIKRQAEIRDKQAKMLAELTESVEQLEFVLDGGDDTIAEVGQVMTAGQVWSRLCGMHRDIRLQFLSIMLDLQDVGRRCYADDHVTRLHQAHTELDQFTGALAATLGLEPGDQRWSELVATVDRQQSQLDAQGAKLNAEKREHGLTLGALGQLIEHLKQTPMLKVGRDAVIQMLEWIIYGGHSFTEAQRKAEEWRAEGGDVHVLSDVLSLVEVDASPELVERWTPEQRRQAMQWATALHLNASDNPVEVPPRPGFLPAGQP